MVDKYKSECAHYMAWSIIVQYTGSISFLLSGIKPLSKNRLHLDIVETKVF